MKQLDTSSFIIKATKMHKNIYDYSMLKYVNAKTKVKIICKKHGIQEQLPHNHLKGTGCKKCGYNAAAISNSNRVEDFIKKSNKIHAGKYDYKKVKYKNSNTNVIIVCKKHSDFQQTPDNHLHKTKKAGCPTCGNINRGIANSHTLEEFIKNAIRIHGEKYDYSKVVYKNANTKVKITCPIHGEFLQFPVVHINHKSNCKQCSFKKITNKSKIETKWLDELGISSLIRQHTIMLCSGKFVVVDGYDPKTNTIYEFYGDFWHGNPEVFEQNKLHPIKKVTYKSLYESTMNRSTKLKLLGYKLVEVWENDYKESL